MRWLRNCCAILIMFSPLAAQGPIETYRAEVIWQVPIGPVRDGTIYRFATCPNGVTAVVNSAGGIILVDAGGVIVINKTEVEALKGLTACACDEQNRLYVAARGWVRAHDFTSAGDLIDRGSVWIAGGPNRLLVAPNNELYVVGLAKVGGSHVFLRRFSLPEGKFLGVPPVRLPLQAGRYFNQLLLNGSVVWDSVHKQVIYIPANPFEFWRLDAGGGVAEVRRSTVSRFRHADPPSVRSAAPPGWDRFDWVRNAALLPGGNIVVHLTRGPDPSRSSGQGVSYSDLEIFDPELHSLAGTVPIKPSIGWFAGADAKGDLCFVAFDAFVGASVTKLRLVRGG